MREEIDVRLDERLGAHIGKSRPISTEEMEARVWRYDRLEGSPNAFLDAAIPGHRRVLYGALGVGTSDEKIFKAVKAAENFHIDYIRAEPGQGAALHSHDSEEVFIAMTGRWKVRWGTNGEHSTELDTFDGISVPSGVMRSFENMGDRENVLMAIIGGRNPGYCVWSESIAEKLAGG
ncbi:MAG: cupin domain-containing protein [Geminicoccaceae bacterium]|nr:cupin domain-containing protein [Geminicoccaceae bacterium]MCB9945602.1 cupin domain-containing protein [Geminicoccaceae bacterium]